MGDGAALSPFVTLTSNIRIGRHFHANLYSYVEHDCVIGDFVTFAPAVKCNGNVVIEDHAYIGAGAVATAGIITLIRSIPTMIESFRLGARQMRAKHEVGAVARTSRDLPFIVTIAQRYKRDAGIGTVIALMLPFVIVILIAWIALFVIWFLTGVPVGPGYPIVT